MSGRLADLPMGRGLPSGPAMTGVTTVGGTRTPRLMSSPGVMDRRMLAKGTGGQWVAVEPEWGGGESDQVARLDAVYGFHPALGAGVMCFVDEHEVRVGAGPAVFAGGDGAVGGDDHFFVAFPAVGPVDAGFYAGLFPDFVHGLVDEFLAVDHDDDAGVLEQGSGGTFRKI